MQTVLAAKKKHYIRCRSLVRVFYLSFYTFFEGVSVVLQTVAADKLRIALYIFLQKP